MDVPKKYEKYLGEEIKITDKQYERMIEKSWKWDEYTPVDFDLLRLVGQRTEYGWEENLIDHVIARLNYLELQNYTKDVQIHGQNPGFR